MNPFPYPYYMDNPWTWSPTYLEEDADILSNVPEQSKREADLSSSWQIFGKWVLLVSGIYTLLTIILMVVRFDMTRGVRRDETKKLMRKYTWIVIEMLLKQCHSSISKLL